MRYAQLQPLQLKSISSLLVTLFVLFWLVDLYVLKIQCSLACFCFSPLLFSSYWLCSRTYQTNLLSLFPRYTKNAFLTHDFVKILSKCKSYLYFLTYTAQNIWSISEQFGIDLVIKILDYISQLAIVLHIYHMVTHQGWNILNVYSLFQS